MRNEPVTVRPASGTSTWEATQARRAERVALHDRVRADTEAANANAVNDFFQNDVLAQAGSRAQARPDTGPDPDLKVRIALDRAASRITVKFAGRPLVEASIQQTIGDAYEELGLFPEAQLHLSGLGMCTATKPNFRKPNRC